MTMGLVKNTSKKNFKKNPQVCEKFAKLEVEAFD
jgi:hypothetical protein